MSSYSEEWQHGWKSSSSVLWNVNAWDKKNCLINAGYRFLTIVYKQCVFLSLPLLKRFHLKFFIYLTRCPSNGVFYTLHWVIWHYSKSLMKGITKIIISHTLSQDETAYIIYKQLAFRYNIQKQPPTGVPRKSCSEKWSKVTGEHPCRSVISIKLQSNFIEILLWHEFSPVNLLHIFRTPFLKNTSGRDLICRD